MYILRYICREGSACGNGVNENTRLPARVFETDPGRLPVCEWLLALSADERKESGDATRTAAFGWPVGMPFCRSIKGQKGLGAIRTPLEGRRLARVLFCAHAGSFVLLHGFIKQTRKPPAHALAVAKRRRRGLP